MKRHIVCCALALLVLMNVAAIAGEAPEADPAKASAAQVQPEQERLHVQYFRVFYDPWVAADRLSGLEAINIHMRLYERKYENDNLEPKRVFDESLNGARSVVWFEYKPATVSRSD